MEFINHNWNTLAGYVWLALAFLAHLVGWSPLLWAVALVCAVINFVAQDILKEIRLQAGAQRILTSRLDNSL